jgi:DNA-binding NtrC family response regulator
MNVLSLSLPPLRERGDDILLLVRHSASRVARRYGLAEPEITEDAVQALGAYPWPGNVRELMHVVERAVLLSSGEPISAATLNLRPRPSDARNAFDDTLQGMTLEQIEAAAIEEALKRAGGNVSEAARRLGVSRMVIRYRMQKHGIDAARN